MLKHRRRLATTNTKSGNTRTRLLASDSHLKSKYQSASRNTVSFASLRAGVLHFLACLESRDDSVGFPHARSSVYGH
jgi:hypothetical protein